jgi:hypothetical protein
MKNTRLATKGPARQARRTISFNATNTNVAIKAAFANKIAFMDAAPIKKRKTLDKWMGRVKAE